ncbi:MAG: methanogenic corrinoid protein MtbC1 [Planctomycetota bacterium]|jgi:methanogenic corrinoid protein MtbC1
MRPARSGASPVLLLRKPVDDHALLADVHRILLWLGTSAEVLSPRGLTEDGVVDVGNVVGEMCLYLAGARLSAVESALGLVQAVVLPRTWLWLDICTIRGWSHGQNAVDVRISVSVGSSSSNLLMTRCSSARRPAQLPIEVRAASGPAHVGPFRSGCGPADWSLATGRTWRHNSWPHYHSMDTRFTASLLRTSASGFAAMAVSRTFEGLGEGGEPDEGFEVWRSHFETVVLELAAAVHDDQPEQFADRMGWVRDAFVARNYNADFLRAGMVGLRRVLEEALPGEAWESLRKFFKASDRELERESAIGDDTGSPDSGLGDLAKAYLATVLKGDAQGAIAAVALAIREGRLSVPDAFDQVLAPALREVGRLWHLGAVNVAQEHLASQAAGRLLEQILIDAPRLASNGRTVVLAMAEGDAHDLGLRIVAAFFELDGWRTICLGANTPSEDLSLSVREFDADLVVIGATLNTHREAVTRAIELLRASRRDQRILVGGSAFNGIEARAKEIGASGTVLDARNAPVLGRALVGE